MVVDMSFLGIFAKNLRIMSELQDRDYAGCYLMDTRTVYLIGANFIEDKDSRSLQYEITALR